MKKINYSDDNLFIVIDYGRFKRKEISILCCYRCDSRSYDKDESTFWLY